MQNSAFSTITIFENEAITREINLYLIPGKPGQRSMLIDCGYGTPYSENLLLQGLKENGIELNDLDIFLTHKHADHCGLANKLQSLGIRFFMNPEENRHLYDCLFYRSDHSAENAQKRVLRRTGITPELAPIIWEKFMDFNSHINDVKGIWNFTIDDFAYEPVTAGQIFDVGEYHLEAIPLRGHSYGQMGLADHEKKLFFIADQVLNRTTPIVGTSHLDEHLLRCYFESLDMIAEKYADYTLMPAHEGMIVNLDQVIAKIKSGYSRKLDQAYECFADGQRHTVWDITKRIYRLTPTNNSDKDFFTAKMTNTKTFTLLEYLMDTGKLSRTEEDGVMFYALS